MIYHVHVYILREFKKNAKNRLQKKNFFLRIKIVAFGKELKEL